MSSENNPLWSLVVENYPKLKEMSVKSGYNLNNKDFNDFKRKRNLSSANSRKLRSVENLDQINVKGQKLFNVDEKYVKVALPIRSIIYMPALVVELIVLIYCMASLYDVSVNISWVIIGIIISSILAMAVPPIPGAVAMLFGILFTQMGIPAEAMAFAVACDAFYDFLDAAVNNSVGIMEFVLQADNLDMLDVKTLRQKS